MTETLFISGMRRSGTTIVLDALAHGRNTHTIYEPLAAARRESVGGGSGVRQTDYFEVIREGRRAFMSQHPDLAESDFNYGAPAKPLLEYESKLPDYLCAYLKSLSRPSQTNLYKFTRMHHKLADLARISPDGALVLVVRDPRAVATSYLYGKGQKHRAEFADPNFFFQRSSSYSAWNSGPFYQHLAAKHDYLQWQGCRDFEKILLVWWDNVTTSLASARAHFADRFFLLRHHDYCTRPRATLEDLYASIGITISPEVIAWAERHVRGRQDIHDPDNPRWAETFSRFGMQAFLDEHNLLKPVP